MFNEKSSHNGRKKIENVKSTLMPNLESVEIGTEKALDMLNDAIGDTLDSTMEQDNYDCIDIGTTEHPDFQFKDPSDIHDEQHLSSNFRSIDLYDDDTLLNMTRTLDGDQRSVLELGINFAKSIIKSKKLKNASFSQELVVVQGGAGSAP